MTTLALERAREGPWRREAFVVTATRGRTSPGTRTGTGVRRTGSKNPLIVTMVAGCEASLPTVTDGDSVINYGSDHAADPQRGRHVCVSLAQRQRRRNMNGPR